MTNLNLGGSEYLYHEVAPASQRADAIADGPYGHWTHLATLFGAGSTSAAWSRMWAAGNAVDSWYSNRFETIDEPADPEDLPIVAVVQYRPELFHPGNIFDHADTVVPASTTLGSASNTFLADTVLAPIAYISPETWMADFLGTPPYASGTKYGILNLTISYPCYEHFLRPWTVSTWRVSEQSAKMLKRIGGADPAATVWRPAVIQDGRVYMATSGSLKSQSTLLPNVAGTTVGWTSAIDPYREGDFSMQSSLTQFVDVTDFPTITPGAPDWTLPLVIGQGAFVDVEYGVNAGASQYYYTNTRYEVVEVPQRISDALVRQIWAETVGAGGDIPGATSSTIYDEGSGDFEVPAGKFVVVAEAWAAGAGGGAGEDGSNAGGSGGGSGEYRKITLSVTPGQLISYSIGVAGTAGTYPNDDATDGGDTTVGSVIIAKGGKRGRGQGNGNIPGAGGTGGTGGTTVVSGNAGSVRSGNDGGAGANAPFGGTGGTAGTSTSSDGGNATAPGAGGGGGGKGRNGGSGANGRAKFTY